MQNGALAEAIQTWKSNFDKEFEGVEECPICYSVIHTTNHSLPRLACRTCKHKFHSACLYKWFSTSHKSSCPLCQSPFWPRHQFWVIDLVEIPFLTLTTLINKLTCTGQNLLSLFKCRLRRQELSSSLTIFVFHRYWSNATRKIMAAWLMYINVKYSDTIK